MWGQNIHTVTPTLWNQLTPCQGKCCATMMHFDNHPLKLGNRCQNVGSVKGFVADPMFATPASTVIPQGNAGNIKFWQPDRLSEWRFTVIY